MPLTLLQGMRCVVSGAGNVATFCTELLLEKGAVVLSLSDSKGTLYEPNGFTRAQLDEVRFSRSGAVKVGSVSVAYMSMRLYAGATGNGCVQGSA